MSDRGIIVLNLSPDLQERVLVALRPHSGLIHIIEDTESMRIARELREVHTAPTLPPPSELDALQFLGGPRNWAPKITLERITTPDPRPLRYKAILALVAVANTAPRRKKT